MFLVPSLDSLILSFKNSFVIGCQWLIPIILVAWEAEIRRIGLRPAQASPGDENTSPK
jgi:hypothetical protein